MQNKQDERVLTQRQKINSEAYGILMIILLASILIQQFFLDAPFEQYSVEVICFFGMSVYILARYMMLGLDLYGEGKRSQYIPLTNSLVTGIIATAIHGVLNYTGYAKLYRDGIGYVFAAIAIFFISITASSFILLSFLNYLNKKKQAKIQKQLDEDEQDD